VGDAAHASREDLVVTEEGERSMVRSTDACDEAGPAQYVVRVAGPLPALAAHWFEDLSVEVLADGDVRLSVTVPDPAALYGILARLRDLGLTLLSLVRSAPGAPCGGPGTEAR